jgi:hypothetical protein
MGEHPPCGLHRAGADWMGGRLVYMRTRHDTRLIDQTAGSVVGWSGELRDFTLAEVHEAADKLTTGC